MKLRKEQEYVLNIYESVASLFEKESENYHYDLNKIDLTKFFTAMFMATSMLYNRVTGEDGDLLDYHALNTRLIFQHLNEKGKEMDGEK